MSAVDVRHAIAQADLALGVAGLSPDDIFRRELRAAGAAVAELIAAVQRDLKARLALSDLKEFGGHEYAYGDEWRGATVEASAAACSVRTALANIGAAP